MCAQHECCILISTFEHGKGGHLKVRLGAKFSVLPMHGARKELGKGLVERIKKDLGLKD